MFKERGEFMYEFSLLTYSKRLEACSCCSVAFRMFAFESTDDVLHCWCYFAWWCWFMLAVAYQKFTELILGKVSVIICLCLQCICSQHVLGHWSSLAQNSSPCNHLFLSFECSYVIFIILNSRIPSFIILSLIFLHVRLRLLIWFEIWKNF